MQIVGRKKMVRKNVRPTSFWLSTIASSSDAAMLIRIPIIRKNVLPRYFPEAQSRSREPCPSSVYHPSRSTKLRRPTKRGGMEEVPMAEAEQSHQHRQKG